MGESRREDGKYLIVRVREKNNLYIEEIHHKSSSKRSFLTFTADVLGALLFESVEEVEDIHAEHPEYEFQVLDIHIRHLIGVQPKAVFEKRAKPERTKVDVDDPNCPWDDAVKKDWDDYMRTKEQTWSFDEDCFDDNINLQPAPEKQSDSF